MFLECSTDFGCYASLVSSHYKQSNSKADERRAAVSKTSKFRSPITARKVLFYTPTFWGQGRVGSVSAWKLKIEIAYFRKSKIKQHGDTTGAVPHLLPRQLHRKLALALWAVRGHLGLVLSHTYSFLFHHVTKNQVTILRLPITLMSATLHFLVTVSFLITKPYHPKASELFHSDSEQEARMASPTPWIRAFPVFVDRKGRMQIWQQWSQCRRLWKPLKPISSCSSSKDCSWGVKHLDVKAETMMQRLRRAPSLPHLILCPHSLPWPMCSSSLWTGGKESTPNSREGIGGPKCDSLR